MAEVDATVMNSFKKQLLLKSIDCDTDSFKVALYSVAQVNGNPDGADVAYSASNEISGSGYTAGGAAVSTPEVNQIDASDLAQWDDDDSNITWSSLAANTIVEANLYDDTTTPKYLCVSWEIATNSNGGDYTLQFGANGILTLS